MSESAFQNVLTELRRGLKVDSCDPESLAADLRVTILTSGAITLVDEMTMLRGMEEEGEDEEAVLVSKCIDGNLLKTAIIGEYKDSPLYIIIIIYALDGVGLTFLKKTPFSSDF